MTSEAIQAFEAAAKSNTSFKPTGPGSKKEVQYLTESDLRPYTKAGKDCIVRFVRGMVKDYETLYHKIVDVAEGTIEVVNASKEKITLNLEEFMSRVPAKKKKKYEKANLSKADKNKPWLV